MAKYAGVQFTTFLVDGYNLIAALSESVTMGKESLTQQTNGFTATSESHTPLNVEKGSLTVGGGFFDAGTNALLGVYNAVRGINRVVCAAIEGNTIGKHFIGYEGAYDQKYELQDTRDGLTKANLNILVSGDVNEGRIVQALAAFTADQLPPTGDTPIDYTTDPVQGAQAITSNSMATASVVTCPKPHNLVSTQIILISGVAGSSPDINGERVVTVLTPTTFSIPVNTSAGSGGTGGTFLKCSTTAGGVGYLQVTDYTGFSKMVHTIMHSPDDSTYAALIAFTDLASVHSPAKERKTVTGTIDRYVSSAVDITGSGSVTLFSGLCRN
jgi:hypothetical protein